MLWQIFIRCHCKIAQMILSRPTPASTPQSPTHPHSTNMNLARNKVDPSPNLQPAWPLARPMLKSTPSRAFSSFLGFGPLTIFVLTFQCETAPAWNAFTLRILFAQNEGLAPCTAQPWQNCHASCDSVYSRHSVGKHTNAPGTVQVFYEGSRF